MSAGAGGKGALSVARERSVAWEDEALRLIDQRKLPGTLKMVRLGTVAEVAAAIKDMVVRGAPAIGAAGAFALAICARGSRATTRYVVARQVADLPDSPPAH